MANMDECANPQLLGWVKEWLDVARERNSKGITTYRRAYDALKACPLTFQHPSELQQLKGFGPKLCERLTDNLKKHCQENGLPMPEPPRSKKRTETETDAAAATTTTEARPSKKRQTKAYVPTLRSGPYALILALATLPEDDSVGLAKTELIEIAQPHCDASFSAPSDPTKFYTAWSSMKTLLHKEMVYERGRPLRRYVLTDEGWEVARRLQRANDASSNTARMPTSEAPPPPPPPPPVRRGGSAAVGSSANESSIPANSTITRLREGQDDDGSLPTFTPIRLPPGSFTVHLLLDVREIRARTDRDYMQQELAKLGVTAVMRNLEVGDAQWIAKCRDPGLLARHGGFGSSGGGGGGGGDVDDEIALDWIVERKRLDDLIGSIKDGRFHEQKFRLARSGAPRVIYIVEELAMDPAAYARYEDAVHSAIAGAQVVAGCFVKRTAKMDDTIRYLARMTRMLQRRYDRGPALHVIPSAVLTPQNYLPLLAHLRRTQPDVGHYVSYSAFASLASKSETMTLKDVYLKMLMTTRRVTGERALEIQRKWKTPHALVDAYRRCGQGEAGRKRKADMVFTELGHLVGNKKFTKSLSQSIAEIWGAFDY